MRWQGYGIEIKSAAVGNWIKDSTARNCKYGFAHGSMNGFVDRSWARNLTAVDCHTAVVTSGSNCVWEGVHVRGASTTAAAIECMVNRVGSGRNNTFEIFVHSIIDSKRGAHVKLHQGTVGNTVDVQQWPAPSQVLTVAFVAGAILEGQSNGIAPSLPTCYGSPSDCGCPAVCPNLTATERIGSQNAVNVRVPTGAPLCSGDCSRNAVHRLNATIKMDDEETPQQTEEAGCCEAVIGNLRVQTLSPTLIRVEPKGPMGFEDRPTFMVVDRSWIGVPILSQGNSSSSPGWVEIKTANYSVLVKTDPVVSVRVVSTDGSVMYDSRSTPTSNLLHWPSPLSGPVSYALEDRPRFFVPEWGPQPMPENAHVEPALRGTNGYDFRNNVTGDMYVFLLGSDLKSWFSSRGEFLRLTGPTPQLPDYAYGT